MIILIVPVFSLGLFSVMGAPQLKLGHSGYEIISINDENPDDSVPLASKLTLESVSRSNRIGPLNLEKSTNPIDEDDGFLIPAQQHKRYYDVQRSPVKIISESRPIMIDVTNKQGFDSSSQKPNIYLTLGIPRRFTHPTIVGKDISSEIPIFEKTDRNPQRKDSFDDSESRMESGKEDKLIAKSIYAKMNKKKSKSTAKLSKKSIGNTSEKIRNHGMNGVSSATFESDFQLNDLKDQEKITALMTDVDRALGLINTKSEFQDKQEKIELPIGKSGFTMVTRFPSIQIHQQATSFVPHKGSAMLSPIYPSGFDILAGIPHNKSPIPVKELDGRHLSNDQKNTKSKKNYEMGLKDNKHRLLLGRKANEMRPGSKEIGKSYQNHRIPSVLVLKNINHDLSNHRTGNIMPFPISLTPLNVQSSPYSNQQTLRSTRHGLTHLDLNSIFPVNSHLDHSLPMADPSILHTQEHWEKNIPKTLTDLAKRHREDNDIDREYLDSEINHVIARPELKAEFLKNYMGRTINREPTVRHVDLANELLSPNVQSSKGFIIGITHEVVSNDSRGTFIDVKKENAIEEDHEMKDLSQTHSSSSSKNHFGQMNSDTPVFYDFLANFSNILLGKALEYEMDIRIQERASKIIDLMRNINLDD